MTVALGALYAAWCGFCWLLRGGKFGAIVRAVFKREPGTTITRISCALLMAAPLTFLDWHYIILWPTIYAAMTIGYFDEAMGLLENPRDYFFMALWGAVVSLVQIVPFAYLVSPYAAICAAGGSLAVVAYGVNKPFDHRLGLDWTERAEIMTGVIFGAVIAAALHVPSVFD